MRVFYGLSTEGIMEMVAPLWADRAKSELMRCLLPISGHDWLSPVVGESFGPLATHRAQDIVRHLRL